jgi:hypothetical protein
VFLDDTLIWDNNELHGRSSLHCMLGGGAGGFFLFFNFYFFFLDRVGNLFGV